LTGRLFFGAGLWYHVAIGQQVKKSCPHSSSGLYCAEIAMDASQPNISIEQWLLRRGFVANPFAHCEAKDEADCLQEYFEFHDCFEKVLGSSKSPATAFLFAARGCGKTACRMMIAQTSRPSDRRSDVLAVEYTDFGSVMQKMGDDWSDIGVQEHVKAILRAGLRAVFNDILNNGDTPGQPYLETVSALRWFCEQYCRDLLEPFYLISELRRAGAVELATHLEMGQIIDAINSRTLKSVSGDSLDDLNAVARFIVGFVDALSLSTGVIETPHDLFASFIKDIACALPGIKTVYILVDELDAYAQIAENWETMLSFLAPLTTDLRLLETPGAAYKFFLPAELFEATREQDIARLDRLLYRELKWSEPALMEVLKKRLFAFNERGIDSLAEMAEEQLQADIDRELVRRADGSPRELMRLGNLLLESHCRTSSSEDSRLSWADLENVFGIPPLTLDVNTREVLIGGWEIGQRLSKREYLFLELLYTSHQAQGREDIRKNVWRDEKAPDKVSDQSIDNLVHRIRRKIERSPGNPVYVITVPGGYRLDNIK
jgi:DNA-binding winged helix-turn-helix (wHTH) protein